jgi:protoporphyrinogen oxidase
MSKEKIIIIGAGPAGMAAAYELYKNGKEFLVIEKDKQVGGLAKTYQFGDFRTDNGPHRFFSKNKYLYDFIKELLGEQWIKVNRYTRFFIGGQFYKYPVEMRDVLPKLGFYKVMLAFFDYIFAKARYLFKTPENFEEYAISKFGRTIAGLNMLNYTEKIWGLPCSSLSVDWGDQRIKGLSVIALLKNFLVKNKGPKTLVDQFYYPALGTGLIYETIKKKVEKNNPMILEKEPVKILHYNNKIQEVVLSDGSSHRLSRLISSIPITSFLNLLNPKPETEILDSAKKLRYRSQVYLFLTINQPKITDDQWIYFPDKEIPFGRISEMKNFSSEMSPKDKTSLFVEFFCWEGDDIWNKNKEELFTLTISWLEKLNFLQKKKVMNYFYIRQKNAYPVYDLEYKKRLNVIKQYLDQFSNLIYIGRPGRFKYTNQDHSLEMGILAARSIIENKKLDIENVGAEKKYFEKGFIKQ